MQRSIHSLSAILVLLGFIACASPSSDSDPAVDAEAETPDTTASGPTITISPTFPSDIAGGAPNATLSAAAGFAWQEFISLTWPAVAQTAAQNTRDTPDASALYGDPSYSGPLTWETYRHKVEIYPGTGDPPGYVDDASKSYGYDAAPQYVYANPVPACDTASSTTPWVNLDEVNEIGQATMYAGIAPTSPFPGQQFLYLAKANRTEYTYAAANGWWGQTPPPTSQTATYVATNKASPPAGSTDLVSFPNGTVELKSAWRQLTADETAACVQKTSGTCEIHTQTIRFYDTDSSGTCYRDAVWGMAALHIIHKTPTAPYFIFASFEQADNILTNAGQPVEDADGNIIAGGSADPLNPDITSKNATSANPATSSSIQSLTPTTADCTPGSQIYFINTPGFATPQGTVCVNRREHSIPSDIITANANAHSAIATYNAQNSIASSVWSYYKLVNVQYKPMTKSTPGVDYSGPDIPTYYLANSVVETNYNLQVFSGQFQPKLADTSVDTKGLITDFNLDGTTFDNTFASGTAYLMGGCMGCHGNAQVAGDDFSFIFAHRVKAPEVAGPSSTDAVSAEKFLRLAPGR